MLQSLLRTYSFYNPDTSYCQGMNYLAGYLYLKIRDEEVTYMCFTSLMVRWMGQIFIDGFKNLKKMIFVLNRLIQMHLPKLAAHFVPQPKKCCGVLRLAAKKLTVWDAVKPADCGLPRRMCSR